MQWISLFDPRTGARFSENLSAPKLENRKTSPCSPRAPIPDGRMAQIMQPCQEKHLDEKINDVVHPVESRDFYRLEPIFCVLVGLKVPVKNEINTFLNTFF